MGKAIKILETLLLAAIKTGADGQFILGVKNSISALKSAQSGRVQANED